jgi:hypothetical protein
MSGGSAAEKSRKLLSAAPSSTCGQFMSTDTIACVAHAFVITCFDRDGRALVRTERAVPSAPLPDEAREYFRTTTLRANASLPAPAQAHYGR